jgi:signal peptidase I
VLAFLRKNLGFILFIAGMGLFRSAIADWNPVPTGSMRPTILEGDVVLVNRMSYHAKLPLTDQILWQTSSPQRGDIAVFSSPKDGTRLVKRIVGLPGDKIALENDQLRVNGVLVEYADQQDSIMSLENGQLLLVNRATEKLGAHSHTVQVLPQRFNRSQFDEITIPTDTYFMMGDNRDNSYDSRFFGPVPRALITGRVDRVLVSAAILDNWAPRFDRFWHKLP